MKDELPASLIKEQAEGGIGADGCDDDRDAKRRQKPFSTDEGLLRTQRIVPSGSACLFWSAFGFFSDRRFFRHCLLSEGEFVGGFERRSADTTDHSGAIAADKWIVNFSGAVRTPQANFFACGWIRGLLIVHSEDERSMNGARMFAAGAKQKAGPSTSLHFVPLCSG